MRMERNQEKLQHNLEIADSKTSTRSGVICLSTANQYLSQAKVKDGTNQRKLYMKTIAGGSGLSRSIMELKS